MIKVKKAFRNCEQFFQKTAFSLVKSRLTLGSPGSVFVTMPKMPEYIGKWLVIGQIRPDKESEIS